MCKSCGVYDTVEQKDLAGPFPVKKLNHSLKSFIGLVIPLQAKFLPSFL